MIKIMFFLVVAGFGINDAARDFLSGRFGSWSILNLFMSAFLVWTGLALLRKHQNSATLLREAETEVDDLRKRLSRAHRANMVMERNNRFYLGSLRSARDFFAAGKDADAFRMISDALAEDTDTSIKKES
jgi:hypothetical protein